MLVENLWERKSLGGHLAFVCEVIESGKISLAFLRELKL